jgi:hypothetical protein
MSELRERMSNAMCLRGMAARTQETYLGAVTELAMFYHRSPAELRVEEVQAYLLHLIRDKKLAYASVNQASIYQPYNLRKSEWLCGSLRRVGGGVGLCSPRP